MFLPIWPTGSLASLLAAPERGAQRGPVPCRRLGDRRARYRTSPRLERCQRTTLHPRRGPPARPRDRRCETHLPSALRALEEPWRSHRPTTPPARLDRQDRLTVVARLPA